MRTLTLLLALALAACGDDQVPASDVAYFTCQDAVKNALATPATAQFPTRPTSADLPPDSMSATITGVVDAQNTFGALVRRAWSCSATRIGDTWHARATLQPEP